jgi:hypothetical protein
VEFPEDKVLKVKGTGKLTALVGTDATAVFVAMVVEEFRHDSNRGFFRVCKKYPYIASSLIDNKEVAREPIV